MKKALITGIAGQDGSYLAEFLLSKGYEVHGLVRTLDGVEETERFQRILHILDQITLHYGDIINYASVETIFEKVEPNECYHLAAQSSVYSSFDTPFATMSINIEGTHNILEVIKNRFLSCKMYFAGSSEMYGNILAEPQNERTPFMPQSPYAISKTSGFFLTQYYRQAMGLFACSGILFNHESPRRGRQFVTQKIVQTALDICEGKTNVLVLGNIEAKRDWGAAREYVKSMWKMLQQSEPDDYVIGTGISSSVLQFVDLALGKLDLTYELVDLHKLSTNEADQKVLELHPKFYRPLDIRTVRADPSKAQLELGWHHEVNLQDLIDEMILEAQRIRLHSPLVADMLQNADSQIDKRLYEDRIGEELDRFEKEIDMHALPEIYHYWSNKFVLPMLQEIGCQSVEDFFFNELIDIGARVDSETLNFVSLGSGNCEIEVALAQRLQRAGLFKFRIECVDLNPQMMNRGQSLAELEGVSEFMNFVTSDLNQWSPTTRYNGVIAHHSLHHINELEDVFHEVKNCLADNGSFIISDMIGRNGHQRWPEALERVHAYWKELPDSYKFNMLLNRHERLYENWDCSHEGFEGIRAQDILPLLNEYFSCKTFIGFGNLVDVFVDRCFGHHFDANASWDQEFIDRIHKEDEDGFASKTLTPTHMFGIFSTRPEKEPFYSRGISPMQAIRKLPV
ncbi:UNVERIFIED_CONTAM: hypothetical protein GTU68_065787 [Idotea baltica]|nr:hypothetical protein [Idotea baltica]